MPERRPVGRTADTRWSERGMTKFFRTLGQFELNPPAARIASPSGRDS